ncbi:MAG: cellobiose phosphorylase, partial [Deltaproteobacteria bacterium]|nr:cellobiose phosphorylase [Deltaproteobacteria bacterium]
MAPFGVNNWTLKEIGRTIEAWMAVYNLEQGVPFYRLRASTEDTAEVEAIEAGHFALSFSTQGAKSIALPPVVDPELVFGHNTALTAPVHFSERPLEQLLAERQITEGKTPCGF